MEVVVLGSAAGGGFPQWNCNAPLSKAAREGSIKAKWRTQASLAVSADGDVWTDVGLRMPADWLTPPSWTITAPVSLMVMAACAAFHK